MITLPDDSDSESDEENRKEEEGGGEIYHTFRGHDTSK
jgi:hypothetical protein